MADGTKIEWADATANYVNGCTRVSPGCGGPGNFGGCYAELLAGTRLRNHPTREGLTKPTPNGPRWTGEVRQNPAVLEEVLRWKRPRRIFWNAHGDLFHPNVPDAWIDRQWAVMALTPQHTHMVLTKRPDRMRLYLTDLAQPGRVARVVLDMAIANPALLKVTPWPVVSEGDIDAPSDVLVPSPLSNVWLGTSVEDRQRERERVPQLLATPAAVRFISFEPLLERPDFHFPVFGPAGERWLHMAIVGGESG